MCFIHMPTYYFSSASLIEDTYSKLKEEVLELRGNLNARVNRSTDLGDIIGRFGEKTSEWKYVLE